jgi:ketosteroid isomerase-like protein
MKTELPKEIADHIRAVNAHDVEGATAPFADDAYVNDIQREMLGKAQIRKFIAKEIVGDSVTMDVREVIEHHGQYIVRAKYDGTYKKDGLPDPLILTNYFSVAGGKIASLIIILNKPSPYS